MSKLYFKVASDWQEVVRLRNEISKLETQIKSMDANKAPQAVAVLNHQMQQTKKQMQGMISDAAKAGAVMENDFKSKIYQSSQSVNDLTQKIINQKAVIKDIEADVKRLGESYRSALKNNPLSASGKLSEYTSAKKALDEEKAALFGITQAQANARLSVTKLRQEYALYKDDSTKIISANDNIIGSMKEFILTIAGADAIKDFISNVISTAGNFQKMEAVLTNSLGSISKAKETMDMLADFGEKTPFQVDELTSAYVKLANQGFTPTMEQMRKLGDLASSTDKSFDQLSEAIIDAQVGENERLKEFGIRASKNGDTITYTFKEQETTVKNTASAIREYILSLGDLEGVTGANEKIAATFVGRLSNIQDELTNQFKNLGEQFSSELSGGINFAAVLVENLNKIIPVIGGLVAAYGTYRSAVLLVTAAHKAGALYENIRLIGMMRKELGLATAAQQAFNTASKANIYAALLSVLLGIGTAVYMFTKNTTSAEKAQLRLNDSLKEYEKNTLSEQRELSKLKGELSGLTKGTDEYNTVKDKIVNNFGKYYEGLGSEIEKVGLTEQAYNKLTEAINRSFGARQYEKFASEQQEELSSTMAENLGNIQDRLLDELGNEYGSKIYAKIRDGVMRGSLSLGKKTFDIQGLDSETKAALDKISGVADNDIFRNKDIEGYIQKIILANKATDELNLKMRERLGIDDNPFNTEGKGNDNIAKAEQKAVSEWLSFYKKNYEDADKAYNDFLKSKQVMSEADRDKELKRLKELRDTAKTTYEAKGGSASSDNKQESAAEKLRKEQEKLTEEIKKSIQERKELLIQSEMDIQQQQIDLKEEGTEKELAQIQLNYDRQYQEIAKRERELLDKLQAEERKQWEKENPNYEKKGLKFTPKTTSLTPEQKVPFDKEYSFAFQKQEKDTQSLLERLLEKYRDFDAQRTAIEKDGNAEIAYLQAKRTDANAKEIDRAIAVAKQKMKEGVQAITDTEASKTAEDNPFLKNLFGDTSQMAFKDLQNLIEQAKQVQAYLSNNGSSEGLKFISTEQLKNIAKSPDELDKLKKALDKLLKGEKGNEWDDIFEDFTKGLAKVKSAKGFKEFSEGMQDIGDSASKASSMIGGVAGNLASMFEEMGNTGAADAMSGVQEAMSAISNIGQGFAKGGIVGGIAAAVGEAANFIGKAFAANARHKAALKEIMNETIAQQREYNLLLMQQNLEYEKATTIFGTDVYGKAINAITVMKDAVSDLNEELRGSGKYDGGYSFILGKGIVDTLSKTQRAMMDSYAGLADIEIKTGHKKTGLFGWGKGKDIYSSILSVDEYKDLIDANGKLNIGMAETIINTKTMSDADKAAFQNIIDLAKQAEEALKAMNDYMTDIFGDLGNTMTDALVDAFVNGTDAAQVFTDSVSSMLETLAKQMVYSVTLAPIIEKAQGQMMDVMKNDKLSNEEKFKQWAGILDGMTDEAIGAQDMANKLLDSLKQSAADNGFDIFSKSKETLDSFVSQMQSAFTSLDVTAKDVSDNIYDYFRQAMINALYEKEYKSKMEELFKDFKDLSSDGLSDSDMAQLGTQVDQYINEMLKGVEGVNSLFADKLKDAADIQSFVDNVKSAMSSIEATAEDVTDNIFEYIRQQMVDKMFSDTFQPQIEEFYKKVQAAMSDGSVTDSEKDALRKEAEKLANDITSAKDILSDTLGVTADNLKKEAEAEFKSFSDGILSSLYNAEVTAEAISKNIADSMRQELIKAMYMEEYEPRIKAIWDKWKEYSSDGLVTDEERASIKNDINDLSKEVADAAKDISDAWTEAGDAVYDTFESFSNSIKSVLQNAETTAEDVAKNIYQFMRNALVNSMFAEQVQPQIKAWYDKYAEYMKDGAIDTTERKTLDEMIAEIQKAGMEIVDAANGLFPSLDTGAIQEAENARNEAEQEWESFSDSMLSSLYDIEASAGDISDDMSEYMRKALIKAMYVNNYKPQMQKWYNEWQRAMGDDILTSEEKQTLDSMKQEMLDGMKKEADTINQMFDSMYSQEASSKGFEGMSQDERKEMNGRFTALQIAGEEIKNQAIKQTDLLSSINDKLTLCDLTNQNLPLLVAPTLPNIAEQTRSSITNSYQSPMKIVFPDGKLDALTSEVSQLKDIVDEMRTNQFDKFTDISEDVSIMAKNTPAMNTKLDNINSNIKKAL